MEDNPQKEANPDKAPTGSKKGFESPLEKSGSESMHLPPLKLKESLEDIALSEISRKKPGSVRSHEKKSRNPGESSSTSQQIPKPHSIPRPLARVSSYGSAMPPPPPRSKSGMPPKKIPKRRSKAFVEKEIQEASKTHPSGIKGSDVPKSDGVQDWNDELKHNATTLIDECQKELQLNPSSIAKSRLHFEIAHAYETAIFNPQEALRHYKESLEHSPDYLPAVRYARRLLMASRDFEAALSLFEVEIRIVGDPVAKAILYFEKGRILEDLMSKQEDARKCYLKGTELDPGNPGILGAIGQVEYKKQDWSALSRTLKRTANAVDDNSHRAALVVERAKLCEARFENTTLAAELYKTAFAADPHISGAIPALKRLLYSQARWNDLIEVLETEIASTNEEQIQSIAFLTIGSIYSDHLGERDKAIQTLTRASRAQPGNRAVWEALAFQHEANKDMKALAIALQNCVNTFTNPLEKLGMLHRIGSLYEIELSDNESAMVWYEHALNISPTYLPSVTALETLYAGAQKWDSLISMYLALTDAAEDAVRRANAHARVAEIYEFQLQNTEKASWHYSMALELDSELDGAFKSLLRLYANDGKYKALVELYENAVDRADEEDRIFYFLMQIGSIYENDLKNPVRAAHAYRRILKIKPKHLGAIHALQRAAESGGRYKDLVEALGIELEISEDTNLQKALLLRIGEIYEGKIDDYEEALISYRKISKIDNAYLPALSCLERVYNKLERWDDLVSIFEHELNVTKEISKKVSLLHKMGEICEFNMGDENRALHYYHKAVEIDPGYEPSRSALSKRLRRRGEWIKLVEIMEKEFQETSNPTVKAKLAFEIGQIEEIHRKALMPAAEAYKRAIVEVPDYRPALDGLSRVNSQLMDWIDMADHLMLEVDSVNDEQMKIDALLRAGEIYSNHLDNWKMAVAVFESVLEKRPDCITAMLSLVPLYRESGSWKKLANVYGRLSEVLQDNASRIGVLLELARLLENYRLADAEVIIDTYKKILAIEPEHQLALLVLERMAISSRNRKILTEVDAQLMNTQRDPALGAVYNARYGLSMEAKNLFESIASYRQALSLDPNCLMAIQGLKRLAVIVNDPQTMVFALKFEADWTQSAERRSDILLKSAVIKIHRLNDMEAARLDASQSLESCPENADAAKLVTELFLANNEIDSLIEILKQAAERSEDSARKRVLFGSVAQLYVESKGDIASGIRTLRRLDTRSLEDVPGMLQLIELYKLNALWQDARAMMEKITALTSDEEMLAEMHFELAQISLNHSKDSAKARKHAEALLKLKPDHREGLKLLVQIFMVENNKMGARETAAKLLELAESSAEQADALQHLGRIELQSGLSKEAAHTLRKAVALSGPNGSAAKQYLGLLGKDEPWENYAEALFDYERSVLTGNIENGDMLGTIRELAMVQHDKLGKPDDAISTLRRGISVMGDEVVLRYDLGQRLVACDRCDEAIHEYQVLLEEDPTRADAWRALGRALVARGNSRYAALAYGPLAILEDANRNEIQIASQMTHGLEGLRPGMFGRMELKKLGQQVRNYDLIVAVFDSMAEALSRLYPVNFTGHKISFRDRYSNTQEDEFQLLCGRLGDVFGLEDFDVYVTESAGSEIQVELSSPVSVFIPDYVGRLPIPEQVFMLARTYARIASGMHSVFKLGVEEGAMLLEAAAYKFVPDYKSEMFYEEDLDSLGRKLIKATPRRNRKAIEEATINYASQYRADLTKCLEAAEQGAIRVSALISGNIQSCVEVIRRTDTELALLRGAELVRKSPDIANLLRYWVSREAFAMHTLLEQG